MQWKVSMIVLTGLSVLFVTGCGTVRRTVTHEATDLSVQETRVDTVREQVMVAVHDTIRETTTIVVDRKENGDTVKTSIVTDRERVRDRAAVKDKEEKVVVKTDTVFVERRDSVYVEIPGQARNDGVRAPPVTSALKWVFWIVVAVTVLVVIFKVSRFFRI